MLLDLIILAIRLATKDANASTATHRKTPAGPVTLECPFCQSLTVANQFHLDQRTGSAWQRLMDTYECPNCRRSMNAEAFHNDGTGVLIPKTWTCPNCHAPNPATQSFCNSCSATLQ
jgi:hypothetical protein